MKKIENYINEAEKHELTFRLILNKFSGWGVSRNDKNISNEDLSIEEIYTKYSTGNRFGIWTILSFKEVGPNVFEFGWQDIAPLSGCGSVDLYSFENGEVKLTKNIERWRS